MVNPVRLFSVRRVPVALLQAYTILTLCAVWMCAFAWFWTYMVIELPKDIGPYSQMSSLSMFLHRAFPMRETNDTSFEYQFEHILILSCVVSVLMLSWTQSKHDLQQKRDKAAAKKAKKPAAKGDGEQDAPAPTPAEKHKEHRDHKDKHKDKHKNRGS
uniref:Uncharacterized protein n=1 Tax=Noctiluca scintillans TaxID=2966 RepID=A0A7S0ZMG6_NOCSC|mmetsp:Transcript_11072/g.30562  ORF Transcript_11072/g.30562 Transcript_11072/m.30562 type:complete len:158 (+) Transcript_11072:61-534(+)